MPAIEILVRGVLVRGGYLLTCRNRRKGNVYLPGGHIEWGESAQVALQREMREEMGREVYIGRFLGACEYSFRQKGTKVCEINLCFEMRAAGMVPPTPPQAKESRIEFFWMPLRDVSRSDLVPDILRRRLNQWVRTARWANRYWASNYRQRNGTT